MQQPREQIVKRVLLGERAKGVVTVKTVETFIAPDGSKHASAEAVATYMQGKEMERNADRIARLVEKTGCTLDEAKEILGIV